MVALLLLLTTQAQPGSGVISEGPLPVSCLELFRNPADACSPLKAQESHTFVMCGSCGAQCPFR